MFIEDGTEVRAVLNRLGLTQVRAAELLGVDARTMRKWVAGERPISEPARRMLALMEAFPAVLPWLEKHVV